MHVNIQYLGANVSPANNTTTTNSAAFITYNATADISIRLEQTQRMNIVSTSIADSGALGSPTRLSIRFENPGSTDLKNVTAILSGDILDKEKVIPIGTVKAGTSGFVDQNVTPQKQVP